MGEISSEYLLNCKHSFCKDCLFDYINDKIFSSDLDEIFCPTGKESCNYKFNYDTIKDIIIDMERYDKFKRRQDMLKNEGLILCPIPDCNSFSIIENSVLLKPQNFLIEKFGKFIEDINKDNLKNIYFYEKKLEIIKENLKKNIGECFDNNNKHLFCLKCKYPYHPNENCDLAVENEFKRFVEKDSNFVKKCPKCKFLIQKNEGCNHMTCKNIQCNYEFCWICERKFSHYHYRNIFSTCFRLSNTSQNSIIVKNKWLFYFRYFGLLISYIILFLLFIPLLVLLIFLCPFVISFILASPKMVNRNFKIKKYTKEFKFLYCCFFQFMTIVLYPLYIYSLPIILCVFPTVFIYNCLKANDDD